MIYLEVIISWILTVLLGTKLLSAYLKRGAALFLSVAMMVTLFPVFPGSMEEVQANRPSIPAFVTKSELLSNFKLDGTGTVGKIKFGADGRQWLIAGADGTDTLAMISKSSFGPSAFGSDSMYSTSLVANNVLPGYVSGTSNFSTAEKGYMKDTTVSILEYDQDDGDTPRTVTGKLYLPDSKDRGSLEDTSIYVGSNNDIPILMSEWEYEGRFINNFFWLRSPDQKSNSAILIAGFFDSSCMVSSTAYFYSAQIVPALNLDLSTVLFGSAINAATAGGEFQGGDTFTLRYASNTLGTANINVLGNSIKVKDAPAGTYLVVQKGLQAWVKSVSGSTTVDVSEVSFDEARISSFTDCKVWLESTNSDRITTAALATQEVESVITPTNSSSGQSNGTGQSTSQESRSTAGVEKITVNVKPGDTDGVLSSLTVERTTDEKGIKSDSMTLTSDNALETVNKLKTEGKSLARIVLEDVNNEVAKTMIQIPAASLNTIAEGGIDLRIDTPEAKIDIPKATIKNTNELLEEDLFFKLVPVNDTTQQQEVQQRAVFTLASMGNTSDAITVLGVPVAIETNMPSSEVSITLPLTGVTIPTNEVERENLLKQLGVYIEHSDGEKVLVKGELVDYGNGILGIRFQIKKFSTFTVVQTDAFQNSSSIQQVIVPENAVINGTTISAFVDKSTKKVTVNVVTGENAKWQLYSNKKCTKVLKNNTMDVSGESGAAYIKVTGADGKSAIYKLVLTAKSVEHANYVKLGLIGSKSYADKVAGMFTNEYECENVTVTKEGKYYRVALDYKDEAIAAFACADMKKRKYIDNYYYVN